jgi:serine/threonine protein kinase
MHLRLDRPFMEEALERFNGVEYHIVRLRKYGDQTLARATISAEHRGSWRDLLNRLETEDLRNLRSRIVVPRESVVRFVQQVAQEVAQSHRSGQIHGDIKPSNVLASRRGRTLIDEVGLTPGEISPTVTIGWSPPEQLCREPVRFSSDVYPLGLLLLRALGCEQLGRQVSYRMPGGELATVVENPAVYSAPSSLAIPSRMRHRWLDLIERALKAVPDDRWPDAEAFAEALAEILAVEPPGGTVSIEFPLGERPHLIKSENGEPDVGWVVADAR